MLNSEYSEVLLKIHCVRDGEYYEEDIEEAEEQMILGMLDDFQEIYPRGEKFVFGKLRKEKNE